MLILTGRDNVKLARETGASSSSDRSLSEEERRMLMQHRGAVARIFASLHDKAAPLSTDGDILKKTAAVFGVANASDVPQSDTYTDAVATRQSIASAILIYDICTAMHTYFNAPPTECM